MKYLILLVAFTLGCRLTMAQTREEKKLIRFAIGEENIWYDVNIRERDIAAFRYTLNNNTLLFNRKYTAPYEKDYAPDSLVFVLTKEDQVLINRQLDQLKGFTWNTNIFKNSRAVNLQTTNIDKDVSRGFNLHDYKNGGYAFTKPVLIRNKTIGFIYVSHDGIGTVMMYMKDKKEWAVKYLLASIVVETR
jgi:hypothetical protein